MRERKRNIEEIDLSLNNSYIYKRGIKLFALQHESCEVSLLLFIFKISSQLLVLSDFWRY